MNKRGRYNIRTPEENQRLLLAAVGKLLRDKGYEALSTAAISRVAGIDRKTIKETFGGKNALIRHYLLSNDFWVPRLRDVSIPKKPKSEEVLRLFTGMLQEQFMYFLSNKELRQVILAQMTKHDNLMHTVNSLREEEGNRVLAMAEEHFRGSGLDIHWVIGLVIGGGYFYGLQGHTGNGPVLGRDIKHERDVEAGLRTMGQLLELVWWAAEQNKKDRLKHRYFRLTPKKI